MDTFGPHSYIHHVRYGAICIDNLTLWLLNDAVPSSEVVNMTESTQFREDN